MPPALRWSGLVEVVHHIPRIYREFRKLVREAETQKPDLAILTDSPDFNLRVANKLHGLGIPVIYLIAPQVWAWRAGRVRQMRRNLARVLCIFPFEEAYFEDRGVAATYIGHPLIWSVRASTTKEEFFRRHTIDESKPLVALLPGSRVGEVARHMPALSGCGGANQTPDWCKYSTCDTFSSSVRTPEPRFLGNGLLAHPSK